MKHPDNWVHYRLGDIGNWSSGLTPLTSNNDNYIGGTIPWLNTGDLNDSYVFETSQHITEYAVDALRLKLNPVNSVMIAMYGATVGKLGIAGIPMTTNQACCVCTPYNNIFYKFLFYYLLGIRTSIIAKAQGATQPNISKVKIVRTPIYLPPLDEQRAIADYLDGETARIDGIVERLTAQRTRYEQLKRSLISEVITKGLLHHDPATFCSLRLKDICDIEKGKDGAGESKKKEGYYPVLALAYLRGQTTDPTFSPISKSSIVCEENELIIIWDGAGIGEILRAKKGLLSSTTAVIREHRNIVLKDYIYALRYYIEKAIKSNPTGMGIPHVNPLTLSTLPIALPTLTEQKEIVDYLDKRCGRIDRIVEAIGRKIELLEALRKSIIEEVVTGKRAVS